jgi:hypothetical protein
MSQLTCRGRKNEKREKTSSGEPGHTANSWSDSLVADLRADVIEPSHRYLERSAPSSLSLTDLSGLRLRRSSCRIGLNDRLD